MIRIYNFILFYNILFRSENRDELPILKLPPVGSIFNIKNKHKINQVWWTIYLIFLI